MYAGDTHRYIKLLINVIPDSNSSISKCICHIMFWLINNCLLSNETKSVLINI